MSTDYGLVNDSAVLNVGSLAVANVFEEMHLQGPVSSAISSGVPGGLSGPAAGVNQLAPGVFQGPPPATTYGLSYTTTSAAAYYAGGTGTSFGPTNPNGAGNLNLFSMKLPG